MDDSCHGPALAPARHAKASFPWVIAVPLALALFLSACGGAGTGSPTPDESSGTPSLIPATPVETAASPGPTPSPAASTSPTVPAIIPFPPGTTPEFRFIWMIDSANGWGIARAAEPEDHVLRTSDGGRSWQDVTPPEPPVLPSAQSVDAVGAFPDARVGWVAYIVSPAELAPLEIHFWRTSGGGQEWESGGRVDLSDFPEAAPIIAFGDVDVGWLLVEQFVGMGHHAFTLLRTQDGGRSWEQLAGPPDSESTCHRTGLAFANASSGWITGECPFDPGGSALLEITHDGGVTWLPLQLPPPPQTPELFRTALLCSARSPHLFGPESGSLVVTCLLDSAGGPQEQSYLYATSDGGATWRNSIYPGGDLYLLDPDRGWALSTDSYWTEDGGVTWTMIQTVDWVGQFSFVDEMLGWAVAQSVDESALARTLDGGRTWELLEPIISP